MKSTCRRRIFLTRPITVVCSVAMLVFAAGGLVANDASATVAHKSAAPYKVIIDGDLSGSGFDAGEVTAAEAVFDQVNSQGGVHGHKINFSVLDDQESTVTAPINAEAIASANPTGIVNVSNSTSLNAQIPILDVAQIPLTTAQEGEANLLPWLYSTTPSTVQEATSIARSFEAALGVKTLAGKKIDVIVHNSPTSVAVGNEIASLVQKYGGTVPHIVQYAINAVSFASQAAEIVADGAQAVNMDGAAFNAVLEAKALTAAGYTGKMLGTYATSDDVTFRTIDSPNFLATRAQLMPNVGTTMYNTLKRYHLTEDPNDPEFAFAWAAAYEMALGLQQCAYPCHHPALIKALNSLGYFTIPGNAFDYHQAHVSASVHNAVIFGRLFRWNGKAAVGTGPSFGFGPPDYS